jgi:hypothetical protein
MTTPHDPAHDPFTGKRRVGMSMLYGSLDLEAKIRYCERLFDEGHEAHIERAKAKLKTMTPGPGAYDTKLHYVTVMPGVLAWTRAEHSRLLALRDSTRRPRRRKTKP